MVRFNSLVRAAFYLATKLPRHIFSGDPDIVRLVAQTLDQDDVQLAKKWLKNRANWQDTEIISHYESQFQRWNGSQYAFAFMGGRVALSACIYALDLKPGDEVILPGYTCIVVPNAFHFAGVKPVYSDIELDTFGLDAEKIEGKITSRTRAILLHHLYGLVCRDYESILALAKHRHLMVIEDCAHATGAEYKGRKVGTRGTAGFYSSELSKTFTTVQGGMAVTNDNDIAARLKQYYENAPLPDDVWIDRQLHNVILNYFELKHPKRKIWGGLANILYGEKRMISTSGEEINGIRPAHYGRRMAAPIAALGLNQLSKIDNYNSIRRHTAQKWDNWCEQNGYKKPLVIENSLPVFLRYPVLVEVEKKRDTTWAFQELGVELGVWLSGNLHPINIQINGCPNADAAVNRCINFPCIL